MKALGALCALYVSAACTPVVVQPAFSRAALEAQAPTAVVLKTNANPLFDRPLRSFMSQFQGEVRVYDNATQANQEDLARALERDRPQVVMCLGNGAAMVAKHLVHDVPVLFVLVPDARKLGLDGLPNFMGIDMQPKANMEFSQFRMVLPGLRRVLAFYGPKNTSAFVEQSRPVLRSMDVELLASPVDSLEDIKQAYAHVGNEVDAVWMFSDPAVVNEQAFDFLREESLRRQKPLITSLSESFAATGALMSASIDLPSMGSQAALMVHRVLNTGMSAHEVGTQYPLGIKLAVNLATAKAIGLTIDRNVLPFINRIYAHTIASKP